MENTISFSEKKKGWNSFHSFIPDAMGSINNQFFTVKNGQLYLHNAANAIRNNYYSEQSTSKISAVINIDPDEDKIFKTLFQEGDDAWSATLETNLAEGTIAKTEFNKRESTYHAYTRRNENESDFHGDVVQGIGRIDAVNGSRIIVEVAPQMVNLKSEIYQVNGDENQLIGTITAITGNEITFLNTGVLPIVGLFCYEKRNSRIEGGDIRGYYMRVDLENENTNPIELFSVGSNVVKSNP